MATWGRASCSTTLRFSLAIYLSFQQQDAKAAAAFYLLRITMLMTAEIELSFTLCKKYRSYSKNWKMVDL